MRGLHVFEHARICGVDRFDADLTPLDKWGRVCRFGLYAPKASALTSVHDTDAHCVCYGVDGETSIPRLTKGALDQALALGIQPMMHWLLIDVDNPDHAPWVDPVESARVLRASLKASGSPLSQARWYLTRAGYRLCWPLASAIPVQDAEPFIRGVILNLHRRGIAADEACADWTRLYRLPRVVRDGERLELPLWTD